MCGGAIISDFIPERDHRGGSKRSLCAADFWPNAAAAAATAFDDPTVHHDFYPADLTGACTFPPEHQAAAEEPSRKRERKTMYRGIRRRPWGKWAAEIRIRGTKAKVNFPNEDPPLDLDDYDVVHGASELVAGFIHTPYMADAAPVTMAPENAPMLAYVHQLPVPQQDDATMELWSFDNINTTNPM